MSLNWHEIESNVYSKCLYFVIDHVKSSQSREVRILAERSGAGSTAFKQTPAIFSGGGSTPQCYGPPWDLNAEGFN